MSGHSKWSQIKHKKALTDKKRGQVFSRLSKLITMAARKGLDPKSNPTLAQAVEKAKSANMPNDNIDRAIKKASEKTQDQLEELSIEAIAPGNVPLKIKAITDNRNRTISEIKKILGDYSAKMVPPGSISWMFSQPAPLLDEHTHQQIEKLFEALDDNDDVDDVISNL